MDELFSLAADAEAGALAECNRTTARYGLTLTPAQALDAARAYDEALAGYGRISFGGGVPRALALAFCDSPFLQQDDYAETLAQLLESFCRFKTESEDTASDDELIAAMRRAFDGPAQGSADYLDGLSFEELASPGGEDAE